MPTKQLKKTENLKLTPEMLLWKENKITECRMTFSCGGDSMNDYEFTFYKGNKEIENDELKNFFEDEVFRRVEFYEASDGHYIGEFGEVVIKLNEDDEDEPDFEYEKFSKSEWSENYTEKMEVELTKAEVSFLNKVTSIVGGEDGNAINYKEDTILSDKEEKISEAILKKIDDEAIDYEFKDANGDAEDFYRFTTSIDDEQKIVLDENFLSVIVSRNFLETREELN